MIINAYEYLFYKLYQWSIKVNGKDNFHKYYTCGMLGMVILINIASIPSIIEVLTGCVIINELPKLKIVSIASVIAVYYLLQYFYFSYKDRYLKILARYENEPKAKMGNIIVTFYVIGSFVLLFTSWFGVYLRREVFSL